jgi:hypothetical protein
MMSQGGIFVDTEAWVALADKDDAHAATQFLDRINSSPRIVKVYSVPEIEKEAEKTLEKFADHHCKVDNNGEEAPSKSLIIIE